MVESAFQLPGFGRLHFMLVFFPGLKLFDFCAVHTPFYFSVAISP